MRLTREHGRGAIAGVVAAAAGLSVSELVNGFAHLRVSPVEAVAECIIRLTPGPVIEFVISHFGHNDKPLVILMTLVGLVVVSAATGILAVRSLLMAELVFAAMGVVLVLAVHSRLPAGTTRYLPALIGVIVAMSTLSVLVERARAVSVAEVGAGNPEQRSPVVDSSRRDFLRLTGIVAVSSLALATFGRVLARSREQVEAARDRLAHRFGRPPVPVGVTVGVDGVAPWVTPVPDFYRVDTSLSVPLVVPDDWQVRIHGMVDKEITLDYEQLLARGITHDWLTLCCVSNPVGGDLISNAYWAGVPIAPILAEARPHPGADAVQSRSVDGWTAGTPLAALTDGRNALFAVAMNGQPLTPEHGFPVRMIVPGLYGYVSGTKWVVDLEVTRFSDFSAFWTERGYSVQAPVKTESRIDVPSNGSSVSVGTGSWSPAWPGHSTAASARSRCGSTTDPGGTAGSRPTRRSTPGGSGRTSGRPRQDATPSGSARRTRPARRRPVRSPAWSPTAPAATTTSWSPSTEPPDDAAASRQLWSGRVSSVPCAGDASPL